MTAAANGRSSVEGQGIEARVVAATAMRRLAHAIVSHQGDRATLLRVAESADRLAAEVEAGAARDRLGELAASPGFAAALDGADLSRRVEDGDFVDLFHDSPVSGRANPLSMGLRIRRDGDQAVGSVTIEPGWEGAPGRGHGGVVAACVDETIGGLLPILGMIAFTRELALDYRAACPLGTPLEFRAWLERTDGRHLYIASTGTGPDGVFVEATAVFIAVDLARLLGVDRRDDEVPPSANQGDVLP